MEVPEGFTHCELCRAAAHVLCPSDDAFLCRRCDGLVHTANFLVARHHRTFLCSLCGCPTANGASGAHLPSTTALCLKCTPMRDVADLCCSSSVSESSDSNSDLTSDCDWPPQKLSSHPASCTPADSASFFKPSRPLRFRCPSVTSVSMSDVEEEFSSAAEMVPLPSCSTVEGAQGFHLPSHVHSKHRRGIFERHL